MDCLPLWAQHLIYLIPTLVVALVGVILSLTNMKRCSSASTMTLLGCGLLGLGAVIFFVVWELLLEQMLQGRIAMEAYTRISTIVLVVAALADLVAMGLIVFAVFTGRESRPGPNERRDASR